MADTQTATGPAPVSPKTKTLEEYAKERAQVLLQVLDVTRDAAIAACFVEALRDRDLEWSNNLERLTPVYKKMGMLEAAKLVCPACARGMTPFRSKPDEKIAATWMHHPADAAGKLDKTVGTVCLSAVVHETLEGAK